MKREQSGTDVPSGVVARVAQGIRYMVTGATPATWFGPMEPLPPQAPPEVAGRQFDFPSGYNTTSTPRAAEPIGFAQLRALADSYDLMRLVIETRKDQLLKCHWSIQPRDQRQKTEGDRRIVEVSDFLGYPDREHDWDSWLRMLVEDMLVIDAATIYPRRTRGGGLYALEPVDGATIKRVLDQHGRTPEAPDPAYQQVLKGLPAIDYTRDELLYLPRNPRSNRVYGLSPVEQVVMTVNIAIRRQIHQLQYYTEGNVPEALIGVPEAWTPDQIAQFQAYWDSLLEGNTAARRHAKFIPGSISKGYVQTKEAALKDEYDEWLARVVCYAFSVSNQPFIKQMSRAESETSSDAALREGLAPLKQWVKSMADRLLWQVWGYKDLEFAWEEEKDIDPLAQAQIDKIYLASGVRVINEVRGAQGWERLPDGDHPLIETASGAVLLADVVRPPAPAPSPSGPAAEATGVEATGAKASDLKAADAAAEPAADTAADTAAGRDAALAKRAPPIDRDRPAQAARRARAEDIWRVFLALEGRQVAAAVGRDFTNTMGSTRPLAKADDRANDDGRAAAALAATMGGGKRPPGGGTPAVGDADAVGEAVAAGEVGAAGGSEAIAASQAAGDAAIEAMIAGAVRAEAFGAAVDETLPLIESAAAEGVAEGMRAIGVSAIEATNLANPRAVAWAEAHGAELVSDLTKATRDALRRLIVRAEAEGWGVDRLSRAIVADHAFSAERASLIARHETAAADIMGNLIGWKASRDTLGLKVKKRWIEYGEARHCPACDENAAAGPIDLDTEFPSGAQAAPAHPRCTCDMVADIERDAEGNAIVDPILAKAFDPSQPRDDHGRWAAEIASGRAAMEKALAKHQDVHDAMRVPEVGPVHFVWGQTGDPAHDFRGGYGLAKIVAKRGSKGRDGEAVARKIPEVLVRGERDLGVPTRMVFRHDGHRVVLTRGGKGPAGPWVLSGYEEDEPR